MTTNADDRDAHERRELHINQLGDDVKLDGYFGKAQGMKILTALNAALLSATRSDSQLIEDRKAAAVEATAGNHAAFNVTAKQRADAFVNAIIDPILESGLLTTCGGAPANVCVTVPLARIEQPRQSAPDGEVHERIGAQTLSLHSTIVRTPNGPGEMVAGSETVQELACDATVQRVVLSPAGKPLDIGRRTRVIPEQIRTALIVRDGGCQFPGCTKPVGWTEGHHIQHWSQGGATSLDNLILLCSRHHHTVHSYHVPITLDAAGIPTVRHRQILN